MICTPRVVVLLLSFELKYTRKQSDDEINVSK